MQPLGTLRGVARNTSLRTVVSAVALGVFAPLSVFAVIAEEVREREGFSWDWTTIRLLDRHLPMPGPFERLVDLATVGGLAFAISLIPVLALRGHRRQAVFCALAVGGVLALDPLLKTAFQRQPISAGDRGYSFPSGSAMLSVALAGTLVFLSGTVVRRVVVSVLAAVFIVAYGVAIVDLRWHYPSDVLAGWCVSLAWVSGLWLVVDTSPVASLRRGATTELPALLRGVLRRERLDNLLDALRFRLDTFPRAWRWLRPPDYHALPWVGLGTGQRESGTVSRWEAIEPLVGELEVRNAIDVGCCDGGFVFRLAERGIPVIGIERDPRFLRMALYTRRKAGLFDASFLAMEATRKTVASLPSADAVLFLALWHHLVREQGLAHATDVLRMLWRRTDRVLFFESGETEMPASWGLPRMPADPKAWLGRYLAETCEGGLVRHLGFHDALSPDHEPCLRSLFAVVRTEIGSAVGGS